MKYIGNKTKLMDWINCILLKENIELKNKIILDGFIGTGAFSKNALKKGAKKIYGCEILKSMCLYSKYNVLGISKLEFENVKFSFLDKKINDGYFYKNFSTDSHRNYFSNENAKKIDSMLFQWNNFNDVQKGLAIDMIDKVSNTSGTYGAFLKIWRSMALKNIENYNILNFKPKKNINKFIVINDTVENFKKKVNIAYLDPPYNTRQYGAYYHLLERIVDRNPNIKTISGVIKTDSNSLFCKKNEHLFRIKQLINNLNAKIIIVSYSNEGIISKKDWHKILENFEYQLYIKKYRRFKTNSKINTKTKKNEDLEEMLFIIKK